MAIITPSSSYTVEWTPGTNLGVPGGIEQYDATGASARTNSGIDVTAAPYNVDMTGVADSASGLQAAVDALTSGQYLSLPAGSIKIGTTITVPSNVTIRGAGQNADRSYKTIIRCTASTAFSLGNAGVSFGTEAAITGGLSKNSTSITIASTAGYSAGDIAKISITNMEDNEAIITGAEPILHVYGITGARAQMVRIAAVPNGTTLTLENGITFPVFAQDTAVIAKSSGGQCILAGIEDLEINGSPSNTVATTIIGVLCYACWIKGCSLKNTLNRHVYFLYSLNCQIRSCIVATRATGGTNGAGILFDFVTRSMIENCQIYDIGPGTEINFGSSGNVVAYNLFNGAQCEMNINHGPHCAFNLYEGNITMLVKSDGYFGGSSRDTLWRNWFTGRIEYDGGSTSANDTTPVALNRFSRYYQIYGNLITSSDWYYRNIYPTPFSFGNPNIGNSGFSGTSSMLSNVFPSDWGMTATVTKISDYEMTLVVGSSGSLTYSGGSNNSPGQVCYGYQSGSSVDRDMFVVGAVSPWTAGTATSGAVAYVTISRLWYIKATKNSSGDIIGSWSEPKQLSSHGFSSEQRAEQAQFSTDNSTWHFGYQDGDTYMRVRSSSADYPAGVNFSGETSGGGNYTDYRFKWSTTANEYETIPSSVNEPSGWTDVPDAPTFNAFSTSTVIRIYPGDSGFQELDLDVETTATMVGNAYMHQGGAIPALQAIPAGDTLKSSLYLSSAPTWWNTGAYAWPPFDPVNPVATYSRLPAGGEFLYSVPPELLTASISASGTQLVLTFTKPVTIGAGGSGGFTPSYTSVTATYASGSGSSVLYYNLSRTIFDIESGTLDYVAPTNGLEDANGVDVASFTGATIYNYSTQTGGAVWYDGTDVASAVTNSTYAGAGWTYTQPIVIESSGLLVRARLYIHSTASEYPIKVGVYDGNRSLVTSGTGTIVESGNFAQIALASTQVDAGTYYLSWQVFANSDPVFKIQTGLPANSSYYDVGTAYGSFPADTAPAYENFNLTHAFAAGLRVIPDTDTVAAPAFSVAAGTYNNNQSVTITSATLGASIRYTTDGSTPTNSVGTVYTGAVTISGTTTLKAIAYNGVDTDSTVSSATYTLVVATPTLDPSPGVYTGSQNVTIATTTSGASIYYTTDGTTPTTGSTAYTGAISVSTISGTIRTLAAKSGYTTSSITSGTYSVLPPPLPVGGAVVAGTITVGTLRLTG